MLEVSLIGTGGMMPLPNRYLTSLAVRLNGKILIIDCGEGTQVTYKLLGWGFKAIDVICITHFHGDHISGLAGLLLTMGNSNREEPVTIIGPKGIAHVAKCLLVIAPELPFEINFIELDYITGKSVSVNAGIFNLEAMPMNHGIYCFGYSINVPRPGKFNVDNAKALNLPVQLWSRLQKGETVVFEDKIIDPSQVLGSDRKPIKVSYCTDTRPVAGMKDFVAGSDLFICEGLYGELDKLEKAREHRHMIFSEAAEIAKDAGVDELWLTHFSPAMNNPKEFIENARNIFKNTRIGYDRICKTINFKEN